MALDRKSEAVVPSQNVTAIAGYGDWKIQVGAIALGLFVAGYVSFLSHPVHLFIPASLTILPFLAPGRLYGKPDARVLSVIGLLFALVILSALAGANPGVRSIGFALFSITPLLLFALNPDAGMPRFLEIFAVAAAIAMIVWSWLLYAFFRGVLGPWGGWTPAGSSNLYGILLTMLWPVLLYFSMQAEAGRATAFRILAGLAFLCALLTFSRAAVICSFSAAFLLLVRGRHWWMLAFVLVLLLAASSQVHAWLAFSRLSDFEPTLGRFAIWQKTLEIAWDHILLGVSPGGGAEALASLDVYHAHSNTLNMLLESGAAAAVLFAVVQIWLGVIAVRLFVAGTGPAYLSGAIGAWLASGQVATTVTNPEVTLTLALIVAAGRLELEKRRVAGSRP